MVGWDGIFGGHFRSRKYPTLTRGGNARKRRKRTKAAELPWTQVRRFEEPRTVEEPPAGATLHQLTNSQITQNH